MVRQLLRRKNYPVIEGGDLLSHAYIRAFNHWSSFNPDHPKYLKRNMSELEKFKIWLYFQVRASRLEIVRSMKAQMEEVPIHEFIGGEDGDEIDREETVAYHDWILAQFSVGLTEVDTAECIEECLKETIDLFSYAHSAPQKRISDALKCWWEFVKLNGREPSHDELKDSLKVSYRTIITTWEDARGQVKFALQKKTQAIAASA